MGKQAKRNAAQRATDPHEPRGGDLLPGTFDRATGRAHIPRRANYWRALPGRRVACDLCYRACELKPGETGWCRIRTNDGGTLRLTDHGVLTNWQTERLDNRYWRSWGKALWAGGMACTAACVFCSSTRVAWSPHRLPWAYGERRPATTGGHAYTRAMVHPQAIPAMAEEWGCRGFYLGVNEPLLTLEWSLDAARIAKDAGLFVNVDTNGFSSVEAIRALAPAVDMVFLGMKGWLSPDFYDRRMRSPGAVPHVKAAALAWKEGGVALGLSDVLTPPHWLADDAAEEQMKRAYTWIAEELGPLTPVDCMPMVRPQREYPDGERALLPRDPTLADERRFLERINLAEATARACGLRYFSRADQGRQVCHHCDAILVDRLKHPDFTLNVGEDGRCGTCGGQTPIVGIARAEYDELQRETGALAA